MSQTELSRALVATVEAVAAAIRDALGEEADAYPGCRSPEEADPLNRAFRAVVRSLLVAGANPGDELSLSVSRTLRSLAERRLAAEGWSELDVRLLIEEEPGHPDDWLAFLALAARADIEPLLAPDESDLA